DPQSLINRSRLDAVLVAVDHRWLRLERASLLSGAADRVKAAVDQLRAIVAGLRQHGGAPAILQTIPPAAQSLFGSFDLRLAGSPRSLVSEINRQIVTLAEETGSYLLDVAALAERVGTDRWFDPVQWYQYKLPFAAEFIDLYADAL